MSNIEVILFDLGGVLIELDGPPMRPEWLAEPLSYEESWRRWGLSPHVQAFETGKIDARTFIEQVVAEQGITLSHAAFREAYTNWPKGLFEGAAELLLRLRDDFTLGFYSNTSELHLPRLLDDLALASYFDFTFASYQIGYFKPDLNGYRHVSEAMGVAPERILFIDDNPYNIEGALQAGFRARQAFQMEQVIKVLEDEGCLASASQAMD